MFSRIAKFWLGIFCAVTAFAAVATYGFDIYEPNWGPAITFQVSMLVAAFDGVIAAVGFGVGLSAFGKTPGTWWCILSGAVVAVLMVCGYELVRRVLGPNLFDDALVLVSTLVLSVVAAYIQKDAAARV